MGRRVEKQNGDLRTAFDLMRNIMVDALYKIERKVKWTKLGVADVDSTYSRLYESKLPQILRQIPRSHLPLLQVLVDFLLTKQHSSKIEYQGKLTNQKLCQFFNKAAKENHMTPITINEVDNIVTTLQAHGVVSHEMEKKKKNSVGDKVVELIMSLEELNEALTDPDLASHLF